MREDADHLPPPSEQVDLLKGLGARWGVNSSADDFLPKPFNRGEFMAAVDSLLGPTG